LKAGIEVDIFPIYPLEQRFWRYVPDCLSEDILSRTKVHHVDFWQGIRSARVASAKKCGSFFRDTAAISASALKFGVEPLVKSAYVFGKALAWAHQFPHNFDHVLAYWGNYAATCAYLFNRLTDNPVPFSLFLHAGTDLYRKQVFLRQKLLYATNIIVVCEFNRNFIREHYSDIFPSIADKIHLHHLGLDLADYPYQPHGRQPNKVLGVGGLEKYKGFDYLLHAARELRCQDIEVQVELVGDGKERGPLEALAKKLKIQDKVRFLGWLPPDQVKTIMKQATLLVHPSRGLGDAVPTVIKESMALGTPIVASNVAGIPELLDGGRCGMLVPPKNVKALAAAMKTLLNNNAIREMYSQAAREHSEAQFDLTINGRRLADLLYSTKSKIEHVPQDHGVLHE
jgi:colanic acid/amylovoran biosynthesis glycosyltransferase